jgi:hypothetical protein
LAERDADLTLCGVILVVLLNVLLTVAGRVVIRLIRGDDLPDEMELLTRLLNRDTFYPRRRQHCWLRAAATMIDTS